jgi:hypothetical protein
VPSLFVTLAKLVALLFICNFLLLAELKFKVGIGGFFFIVMRLISYSLISLFDKGYEEFIKYSPVED